MYVPQCLRDRDADWKGKWKSRRAGGCCCLYCTRPPAELHRVTKSTPGEADLLCAKGAVGREWCMCFSTLPPPSPLCQVFFSLQPTTASRFSTGPGMTHPNSLPLPLLPLLCQVDLERAIRDGIQFCKAANGVVLCEGPIPLRYIQRVRLSELPQYWQDEAPNKHVGER